MATGFAIAWVVLSLMLAWAYLPDLQATLGAASAPALVGLGAVFLAPVVFIYLVAHMVARAANCA